MSEEERKLTAKLKKQRELILQLDNHYKTSTLAIEQEVKELRQEVKAYLKDKSVAPDPEPCTPVKHTRPTSQSISTKSPTPKRTSANTSNVRSTPHKSIIWTTNPNRK